MVAIRTKNTINIRLSKRLSGKQNIKKWNALIRQFLTAKQLMNLTFQSFTIEWIWSNFSDFSNFNFIWSKFNFQPIVKHLLTFNKNSLRGNFFLLIIWIWFVFDKKNNHLCKIIWIIDFLEQSIAFATFIDHFIISGIIIFVTIQLLPILYYTIVRCTWSINKRNSKEIHL